MVRWTSKKYHTSSCERYRLLTTNLNWIYQIQCFISFVNFSHLFPNSLSCYSSSFKCILNIFSRVLHACEAETVADILMLVAEFYDIVLIWFKVNEFSSHEEDEGFWFLFSCTLHYILSFLKTNRSFVRSIHSFIYRYSESHSREILYSWHFLTYTKVFICILIVFEADLLYGSIHVSFWWWEEVHHGLAHACYGSICSQWPHTCRPTLIRNFL